MVKIVTSNWYKMIKSLCICLLQLFWEKRLRGLRACDSNEELMQSLELPKAIQGKKAKWYLGTNIILVLSTWQVDFLCRMSGNIENYTAFFLDFTIHCIKQDEYRFWKKYFPGVMHCITCIWPLYVALCGYKRSLVQ